MISRVASVLVFLAALLGSGALLSEVQPFSIVPELREKYAWFAAHADDYDTLFIGSSRIYRGIQPTVFDELTAAAGVPTHSFNFGIDGMAPPEDAYVFERLAALRPKHLRWIFIESGAIRPGVGSGGEDNVRSLHWHDTARTMLVLRALLAPTDRRLDWSKVLFGSAEDRRPLTQAIVHLRLWCTRTLNAGRGAWFLRSWLEPPPHAHSGHVIGAAHDGFMPAGEGVEMPTAYYADYQRRLAQFSARPAPVSFLDRDAQQSLEATLARLGVMGARPVLLVPPTLGEARPYPQPGGDAPVFDYGEVAKWPALFEIGHRVDHAHLNAVGADCFTRAVAADFIGLAGSQR